MISDTFTVFLASDSLLVFPVELWWKYRNKKRNFTLMFYFEKCSILMRSWIGCEIYFVYIRCDESEWMWWCFLSEMAAALLWRHLVAIVKTAPEFHLLCFSTLWDSWAVARLQDNSWAAVDFHTDGGLEGITCRNFVVICLFLLLCRKAGMSKLFHKWP